MEKKVKIVSLKKFSEELSKAFSAGFRTENEMDSIPLGVFGIICPPIVNDGDLFNDLYVDSERAEKVYYLRAFNQGKVEGEKRQAVRNN